MRQEFTHSQKATIKNVLVILDIWPMQMQFPKRVYHRFGSRPTLCLIFFDAFFCSLSLLLVLANAMHVPCGKINQIGGMRGITAAWRMFSRKQKGDWVGCGRVIKWWWWWRGLPAHDPSMWLLCTLFLVLPVDYECFNSRPLIFQLATLHFWRQFCCRTKSPLPPPPLFLTKLGKA